MVILELLGLTLALIISFYLMARVCDEYFVESLDKLAKRFNMSSDAAGATLMAMGSSAPELFISMIAIVKVFIDPSADAGSVGIGTIVGSAIFNVLIIIGASVLAKKAIVQWQPVIRDLLFYSLSIIILIVSFWDLRIDLWETIIFLALYIIYVFAVMNWRKILPYTDEVIIETENKEEEKPEYQGWKIILLPFDKLISILFPKKKYYIGVFVVSILIIAALSWLLVESAVHISHILAIPPAIVALTVLAVGTSVPDLISSILVAKQGRGGMAVSNAFGSNIFDILIGLGVPWLIYISIMGGEINVSEFNFLNKRDYISLEQQGVPVGTISTLKAQEKERYTNKEFSAVLSKILSKDEQSKFTEVIITKSEKSSLLISSILLFGSVIIVLLIFILNKWELGFKTGVFLISLYVLYVIWELVKVYIL